MTALPGNSLPRLRRVQHVLAALILVAFIVLAWRVRPEVGIGTNDELEYRALSQSLAHGEYREIFVVGAAPAHKYPPVFPAWLAFVRVLAGDHFDLVRAANLAFFAGALLIIYIIGSSAVSGWGALVTIALVAVNPYALRYAASMMSEPLYLLLSIAAIAAAFVADRYGTRAVIAAATFALLAFLTRSAGITIVAAIGVWLLTRRSRAEIASYTLASAIVVGGWFAYSAAVTVPGVRAGSYETELLAGTRQTIGERGVTERLRTLVDRVGWIPSTMDLPRLEGSMVDNVVTMALVGSALAVGLFVMWKTWPAAVAYTVIYLGLMAGWPFPNNRLQLPILPLTLLISAAGTMRIARLMPPAARIPAALILVVVAAFNPVQSALVSDARFRECDRAAPYTSHGCFSADERAIAALSKILAARSADTDVVAVHTKPASVFFLTGRRTAFANPLLRLPPHTIADTMRARPIRFMFLTRYSPEYGIDDLVRTLQATCRDFNTEASLPPNGFLLSVTAAGDTSGNSCATLDEFARVVRATRHSRGGE